MHPLQMVVNADYMGLCALLGHDGPTASFPCIHCEVSKRDLEAGCDLGHRRRCTNRCFDAAQKFQGNLPTVFLQYSLAFLVAESGALSKKNLSQRCRSISATPMLRIPIVNYAPPLLHIWLGIGADLLLLLGRILLQLDAREVEQVAITGISFCEHSS